MKNQEAHSKQDNSMSKCTVNVLVCSGEDPQGGHLWGVGKGPESPAGDGFRSGRGVRFPPLRCQGKSWLELAGQRESSGRTFWP